ncbi:MULTISPECIES: hypothetical protein [Bacillus]|uniref:hypothetical protein n=1 Tax=Bacillus TaxID=1386 RepID=UPI0019255962|nr:MULTISPECIES: hypothetical protein [Bacillus]MBL3628490.1 hypothetical protein [Bacillus sp. RHF6]MDM5202447.1 hypothetical protein [Bacillus velezensis]MED4526497.1 hypothetical protein [Bacillus velezensis]
MKNPFEESVKKLATEGLCLLLEDIKHRIRDALLSENQSYLQQQQQRAGIVKKEIDSRPASGKINNPKGGQPFETN